MARMLVVDDEVQVARALRRLLMRAGHEVELAHSGPEALQVIGRWTPDLVLSDFRMGEMNGAQLLARVKREVPSALRVIISGYADLDSVIASVNEGEICRFINKPWEDASLVAKLAELLKERELGLDLGKAFERAPPPIRREVIHHERSVELRLVKPEPFSAQRAIELIQQFAGLLADQDLNVVSGMLQNRGGKLTFVAEVGSEQTFSVALPIQPAGEGARR